MTLNFLKKIFVRKWCMNRNLFFFVQNSLNVKVSLRVTGIFRFEKNLARKGKRCVCVSETSGGVHAGVSETHVSWTFPYEKGTNNCLLNVAGIKRFF